EVNFSPSWGN
nr:adipokinetic hormone, Mcsp-AKH=neuropeptide hormone [Magicicada, corpora cardiaca of the periodical cicadas, Peptide, 10 aa] [Magicicada]prf//2124263A adipokinetic hormone [Cacama valvata]